MNDNLILTVILAAILMGFVVVGLGIGRLLTGKSRLKKGCGYTPGKKNSKCPLCNDQKECDNDDLSRKTRDSK